jgi:hypothetical protein
LVKSELDGPPEVATNRGEQLLRALRDGNQDALRQLFHLAARHPTDFDLYMDVLVNLDADEVRRAVSTDPATAQEVVRAMAELHSGAQVTMEYGDIDRLITWLLVVAYRAEAIQEWDLLETASMPSCSGTSGTSGAYTPLRRTAQRLGLAQAAAEVVPLAV